MVIKILPRQERRVDELSENLKKNKRDRKYKKEPVRAEEYSN